MIRLTTINLPSGFYISHSGYLMITLPRLYLLSWFYHFSRLRNKKIHCNLTFKIELFPFDTQNKPKLVCVIYMLLSNLVLLAIDRLDLVETPSLMRPNRIQRMKVGIWINFKRLIEEFGSAQLFLTPHSARNNYRYGPELLRRRTSH